MSSLKNFLGAASVSALCVLAPLSALAAESTMTDDFVRKAAVASKFEIESSQLALEKSHNKQIKDFAQMMIDDHTKADRDLKAAVRSSDVDEAAIPDSLDEKHQAMLDKLNNAKGKDFDRQYIKAQAEGHKEAVTLFDKYAKKGDDDSLKKFASNALPTLKDHKDQVKQLKAR